MNEFTIKDSGQRASFASGMVRDVQDGKVDWIRIFDGPMLARWAQHLTAGAKKYPNVKPNVPNWTLAAGEEEYERFRASAVRHFIQWVRGDRDEDHAAAVLFNINGAEYVRDRMLAAKAPLLSRDGTPPSGWSCSNCGEQLETKLGLLAAHYGRCAPPSGAPDSIEDTFGNR